MNPGLVDSPIAELPEQLRREAAYRGLPVDLVDAEWVKHVRWCQAHQRDAGGRAWSEWVKRAVADLHERATSEELRKQVAERKAKALARQKREADAEYAATAVPLRVWVEQLIARRDAGMYLSPEEQRIAAAGLPPEDASVGEWLIGAMRAAS